MKSIKLTRGLVTFVDDDVYEWASKLKWYASSGDTVIYALRKVSRKLDPTQRSIRLHREIMQPKHGLEIDHINGNGLDNRRENLRVVTRQENKRGFRRKNKSLSSRFRGVCRYRKKWQAGIKVAGRRIHLGHYVNEIAAARAYDRAAKEFFGKFASPNFS